MTIATDTARTGPYSGNGSTVAFAYGFKVIDQAHLVVTLTVTATGVQTVQTLTTHYSVSGVGESSGGNVTMETAPTSAQTLTISRAVTKSQTTDLVNRGAVQPEVLETALDRGVQMVQDLDEVVDRSVRFAVSANLSSFNPDVPTPVASKIIGINAANNAFELIDEPSASAATATTKASEAAASAVTASTKASEASSSASTASGHASTASTQATLATNYAVKVDGVAASSDHSSKAWAVGGSGVTDTSGKGAAKEWSIETSGTVDGTSYSSKEYALGVQGSNGGSSKQWALGGGGSYTISTAVSGGLYSAKYHAAAAEASAQAANNGQLYSEVVNKAVSFTVDNSDDGKYFIVDTSGGDRTVTLSAIGANDGRRFAFQKTSASNDLIFDPQGSDRVNGSASNYLLSENSEVVILVAHNDDDDVLAYDNWIATIQSQTVAGAGLTKSGSSLSLNLAQDQSWTGSQRSTPVANTSGSFDMATGNNFNYTPSGNQALTFTNITAGQGGILYVVNSGHTITKHASVKVDANLLATVTAAGTYMLGYYAPTAAIIVVTNSLAVT